jgi:hypothetical protein
MSNVRLNISGFKELSQALGEMTPRMADAAARKAVRAAARPVVLQARANLAALPLTDSTGLLSRSLGVKVRKYKGRRQPARGFGFVGSSKTQRMYAAAGITMAIIGPRKGFGAYVQRRVDFGVKLSAEDVAAKAALARDAANTESLSGAGIGDGTRLVYSDPVKYAHLIEGGVRPHRIGKGSSLKKGRGKGAMHPGFHAMAWLEPAINSRRNECLAIMQRVFREALAQEAARARAKVNGARRAA